MATEFSGFESFAEELEDFAEAVGDAADAVERGEAVDRGVEQTARDIARYASRIAPRDTGDLAESIHAEQRAPGEWVVISREEHAKPQEYGTAPYTIRPNEAEALSFVVDGERVTVSKVEHPGVPASPFLRPSIQRYRSALARNIRREIRRTVQSEL